MNDVLHTAHPLEGKEKSRATRDRNFAIFLPLPRKNGTGVTDINIWLVAALRGNNVYVDVLGLSGARDSKYNSGETNGAVVTGGSCSNEKFGSDTNDGGVSQAPAYIEGKRAHTS